MFSGRKQNIILLLVFLVISLLVYGYIYIILPDLQQKIENKIIQYSVKNVIYSVNKLIKNTRVSEGFIRKLRNDRNFRLKVKNKLEFLITDELKYIFILYREKSNRYRYILDASADDDMLNFPFIPLKEEKEILEKVYQTQKPLYVLHKSINTIGITYLQPILEKGKTTGIIVIDFSTKALKEIEQLIWDIKTGIMALGTFTVLFMFIISYYFIKSFILKKRVFTDPLTGVYNRNYLEEISGYIDIKEYVVMLIDIDHFKRINDTYGHDFGDKVLSKFANILKSNLRKDDIIIRYGGEEFLVLLKNRKQDKRECLRIVERLLSTIRRENFDGIKITASVGINLDTPSAKNIFDAIKKADTALYKAKKEGRNRIELYSETHGNYDISIAQLKEIIENEKIVCFYHPVVNMLTGEVLYYESLARIIHNGNIYLPAKYISQIKGTFLYSKFTKNVIQYNIKMLKKHPTLTISINLSPSDILNDAIIHILLGQNTEIIKRIKLEIIETEDVSDYETLKKNVRILINRGYEIALDDFGRGYINFYYLTEIRAEYLKIDGFVIKNLDKNIEYTKVIKSLLSYCKDSGKKAIAEFIEDEKSVRQLIKLGFTYGQGYYFAVPKPVEFVEGYTGQILNLPENFAEKITNIKLQAAFQ